MLSYNFSLFFGFLFNYIFVVSAFSLAINKNSFVFTKIWVVFMLFIVQSIALGFFGEDFFVILILASEFPIFFCFFFVYITKSNLSFPYKTITPVRKQFILGFFSLFFFYWVCPLSYNSINHFVWYDPSELNNLTQKSDFYLFYIVFYVKHPEYITLVGVLIGFITLVVVIFSFKNQIVYMQKLDKNKKVQWARTQDQSTQNNQKKTTIFFRI